MSQNGLDIIKDRTKETSSNRSSTWIPSTTIAGAGQHSFNTCLPRTEDEDLPTKFWFNVGPASQPIAGSMPVKGLWRWPNTNPSLGLLYTFRKHVEFTQCCWPTVFDAGSSLNQYWVIVQCFLTAALCCWRFPYRSQKHQRTRYIGPMLM